MHQLSPRTVESSGWIHVCNTHILNNINSHHTLLHPTVGLMIYPYSWPSSHYGRLPCNSSRLQRAYIYVCKCGLSIVCASVGLEFADFFLQRVLISLHRYSKLWVTEPDLNWQDEGDWVGIIQTLLILLKLSSASWINLFSPMDNPESGKKSCYHFPASWKILARKELHMSLSLTPIRIPQRQTSVVAVFNWQLRIPSKHRKNTRAGWKLYIAAFLSVQSSWCAVVC